MRLAILFVLLSVSTAVAPGDDDGWSPDANGLRARLVVLPPEKPGLPFCRILIEMENVRNVAGQMKVL